MRENQSRFLPCLLLCLSMNYIGCSKLKDMQENAKAASDNSGDAAEAASESREEIAYGRIMGRSGESSKARRDALSSLMDMKSFEMKATEASKYLKSFEFQLWTGQRYDTSKYLNALKKDALEEFFRSLVEINGDNDVATTDFNPVKKKDLQLNVLAISVALHSVHTVQEHITTDHKKTLENAESMYSLIKRSLLSAQKVQRGTMDFEDLKSYERVVFKYKKEALKILQGRIDMLIMMALCKISPIKDSMYQGFKLVYLGRPFNSRYINLELGLQATINKYIEKAKATSDFLRSIGNAGKVSKSVETILTKMKFTPNSKLKGKNRVHPQAKENRDIFFRNLSHFVRVQSGKIVRK